MSTKGIPQHVVSPHVVRNLLLPCNRMISLSTIYPTPQITHARHRLLSFNLLLPVLKVIWIMNSDEIMEGAKRRNYLGLNLWGICQSCDRQTEPTLGHTKDPFNCIPER